MEENKEENVVQEAVTNTEVTTDVESSGSENVETAEVQVVDGVENPVVATENSEIQPTSEFSSGDEMTPIVNGTPIEETVTDGTPINNKKKVNKTLVIVLVFVVIFGGVMLLMNMDNGGNNNNNNDEEKEKEKIKVNVGTDWGDKYLAYMMEEKPNLKKYQISFVDVNFDDTPEMFVKYIDNSDLESMIILYIAKDGYVYETKYYRDYRIRLIYSLKTGEVDWYLFLTTTKHYGSYTSIAKIIDNMAFDADIKATNDALLIEYGKKYFDTDYQPVFYSIKENTMEEDFKDFVSKYPGYNEKVKEEKEKVYTKFENYEYVEEEEVVSETVGLNGRIYNYGTYLAVVQEDPDRRIEAHTAVLILYHDNKISVDGKLYTYTTLIDESKLKLSNGATIDTIVSNKFNYHGHTYEYVGD